MENFPKFLLFLFPCGTTNTPFMGASAVSQGLHNHISPITLYAQILAGVKLNVVTESVMSFEFLELRALSKAMGSPCDLIGFDPDLKSVGMSHVTGINKF